MVRATNQEAPSSISSLAVSIFLSEEDSHGSSDMVSLVESSVNQPIAYDVISRREVAVMHSGQ